MKLTIWETMILLDTARAAEKDGRCAKDIALEVFGTERLPHGAKKFIESNGIKVRFRKCTGYAPASGRRWTNTDDAYLLGNVGTLSLHDIAAHLDRTYFAINDRLKILRDSLAPRRAGRKYDYSDEDVDLMAELYEVHHLRLVDIADKFDLPVSTLRGIFQRNGVFRRRDE